MEQSKVLVCDQDPFDDNTFVQLRKAGFEIVTKETVAEGLRILERGYAIVEDDQRRILKDASAVAVPSMIDVHLARGRLQARVTASTPGGSSELPS